MMNVDDALRIAADEIIRQDLHVAGEHHEIRLVLVDKSMKASLSLGLVLFAHRHDLVRNLVEIRNGLSVGMVGDDQWDLAREFAALLAIQKIDEAVIILRNENHHPRAL